MAKGRVRAKTTARGYGALADGAEELVVRRCPSCGGLRGVYLRHADRIGGVCKDCRRGRVVRREEFYEFWLERFTAEELREMARALWHG